MSEVYDITEVIKKLDRMLGKKWVAIVKKANLKLKVREGAYFSNGNGLARLRLTLRSILGKEVADDILSLAKPLAAVKREIEPAEIVVKYDRASIEHESKALIDPIYFSSLLIRASVVAVEKMRIEEFNLQNMLKELGLKSTETYFVKITHESGDVFKLIVDKGVVKAIVLERREGINVLGSTALEYLLKIKGVVEIMVLKLVFQE